MQYVVLLALAVFFGFAFEQFYGEELTCRPGGVRVFPLLSFAGAALYTIDRNHVLAFTAGLIVLGAWLFPVVLADARDKRHGYLMAPVCATTAYVLGPVALTQPLWLTVALVVAAVLLIGSRARLHALAQAIPFQEVLTLGQFLLLVGVVLPLLAHAPPIPFTTITPFKVWLAVVAVSTISYLSYLLARYALPRSGVLLAAILGGLYSSTATTIVLARAAATQDYSPQLAAGTIAATGMMYFRLLVVAAIFNVPLARALVPALLVLGALSVAAAALVWRAGTPQRAEIPLPENPLQLGTAVIFAALLVGFSELSTWATVHLGGAGLLALAAVVGFTDIDPFVLGIAQASGIAVALAGAAILIAASPNNVLKGVYAVVFSRRRASVLPASMLLLLAGGGVVAAWIVAR